MSTRFTDTVIFVGTVDARDCDNFKFPLLSVEDEHIAAPASQGILSQKLEQRPKFNTDFRLDSDDSPASKTIRLFVANGNATVIRKFQAMMATTGSATSTNTFDLHKNGSTILTSVVTISDTDTDDTMEDGTLTAGASLVDGDIIDAVLIAVADTGSLGPFCQIEVDETPEPI